MIISSREEKFYRVIQAVHDSMELCIQPTSKKIKWEYYFPEIFAKKCGELEAVCTELVQEGKNAINKCCDDYIQAARESDLLDGSKLTLDAVLLNGQFKVKAADLTAAFDRAEGNRTMQRLIAEYASKKDLLLVRVFHTAESKAAGAEILRQYTVGILSDPWRFAFDVQEVLEEQGSTV